MSRPKRANNESCLRTTLIKQKKFAWLDKDQPKLMYTHSFMDGGLAFLETNSDYDMFSKALIQDILKHDGKVVVCEGFPHIFGTWPSVKDAPALFPSIHLFRRAFAFFGQPVPAALETKLVPLSLSTSAHAAHWDETCFVVDLDYGYVPRDQFSRQHLHDHIRVIQQTLRRFGADKPALLNCYVFEAYEAETLGIHLYFIHTRYYPEECAQLALHALHALNEAFPHPHFGLKKRPPSSEAKTTKEKGTATARTVVPIVPTVASVTARTASAAGAAAAAVTDFETRTGTEGDSYVAKAWSEILDVSIYNKTLRMPFVQKYKRDKKTYVDRRYWPKYLLDADGKMTEEEWLVSLSEFLQHRPDPSKQERSELLAPTTEELSLMMKRAFDTRPPPLRLNDERCEQFLSPLLIMISLRKRSARPTDPHTPFLLPPEAAIASLDRTWDRFFRSILDRAYQLVSPEAQMWTCVPTTWAMYQTVANPPKENTVYILQPTLRACTNPLGFDKVQSSSTSSFLTTTLVPVVSKTEEANRKRWISLISSPNDTKEMIDLMSKNNFQRGISGEEETPAHDPFLRCHHLQAYLRNTMATFFATIQVIKIALNEQGEYYNIRVLQPGVRCMIKDKRIREGKEQGHPWHRSSTIYFRYSRGTRTLYQYCFNSKCRQEASQMGYPCRPFSTDLTALFAPYETLKESRDMLRTDTVAVAEAILKQYPSLNKPVNLRRKRKECMSTAMLTMASVSSRVGKANNGITDSMVIRSLDEVSQSSTEDAVELDPLSGQMMTKKRKTEYKTNTSPIETQSMASAKPNAKPDIMENSKPNAKPNAISFNDLFQ